MEVEIETPRGVSHTFSPVKSEFAFDKLVLTGAFCSLQIYEFVANNAISVPTVGWVGGRRIRMALLHHSAER